MARSRKTGKATRESVTRRQGSSSSLEIESYFQMKKTKKKKIKKRRIVTPSATRIIRSTEKEAEILSSFDSFILLQFIIIYNYNYLQFILQFITIIKLVSLYKLHELFKKEVHFKNIMDELEQNFTFTRGSGQWLLLSKRPADEFSNKSHSFVSLQQLNSRTVANVSDVIKCDTRQLLRAR